MIGVRRNRGTWGGWGAALAALALFIQVLLPQGFMASREVGSALPLVICTGHGPLLVVSDLGGPTQAPKTGAHDSCLFAGHGPAVSAPAAPTITAVAYHFVASPAVGASGSTPPPGLAAPPPPSQASPIVV